VTNGQGGQIITFYSYKGGTGRTMALSNVAWILAASGKRVLVVDWDLESPGLHRFFRPFISEGMLSGSGGVIELILAYENAARQAARRDPNAPGRLPHASYARVGQHAFSVLWEWEGGGTLDFLRAGRHNHEYSQSIAALNWDDFYEVLAGGFFFDALREDMKANYDYVLIDSRTGLSDVADVCTVHLPDTLVTCFTLSDQGIEGAAEVARLISRKTVPRQIRVLPLMTRIDLAEMKKAEIGRQVARQRFAGLPLGLTEQQREAYWSRVEVPYRAFYAYEETLATFEDEPGKPNTLLASFEALTSHLTNGDVTGMPIIDRAERGRVRAQFVRTAGVIDDEVTLRYPAAGTVWAEWIAWVLAEIGVRVNDPGPDVEVLDPALAVRQLVINVANRDDLTERSAASLYSSSGLAPYVVHVAGAKPPSSAGEDLNVARFRGSDPWDAAEQILRLVGAPTPSENLLVGAPRYPGDEPPAFNAPPQNPLFTGRARELAEIRRRFLADPDGNVVVGLFGLGGVGKSQIALEYVHRFRSAYDVVWWIDADQAADLDDQFHQLGIELGIGRDMGVAEGAQAVRQALSRGEPFTRWLLVIDNAERTERVDRLLPSGPGHVLVLAQTPVWEERATVMPIGLFTQRESVQHLRSKLALDEDEANRIAELLGNLPIAIAAARVWLSETGMPPAEYIAAIEKGDLGMLGDESEFARVAAVWRLSLERLEQNSAAAYRMLEYCAVTAPEISSELIYSDTMIRLLGQIDSSVRSRLALGRLVTQIRRFGLIRVDTQGEFGGGGADRVQGGHIEIHRLLQLVVRNRMGEDRLREIRHDVHVLLIDAVRLTAEVDEPTQWPRYRILWPHIEVSKADGCSSPAVRRLLVDRVRYLYIRGNPERGLEIAEQTERTWTDALADRDDPELAQQLRQLRFNRANILRERGLYPESLQLDEEIYEWQKENLGESHEDTLVTAGSLGGDLRGLGRYAEALSRDEETYQSWRAALYDEHPRTLTALSNLAVSHRLMGHLLLALELDQQVYDLRRAELSRNHPSTLLSGGSLGRDLREAGEYTASVALLQQIRDNYAEIMGEDSRFVVNAQVNLAVSMRTAGRPGEAAAILDDAYRKLVDLVGESHPDTLACRLSRAVNLLEMDRYEQAEMETQQLRLAYGLRLGENHPHTLVCVNNLAAASRALGSYDEARDLATTAMDRMGQALGEDHPYAIAAQMNLAVIDADDGRLESAQGLMDDAGNRLVTVLGADHPHTLRCRANLAVIHRRLYGPGRDSEVLAAIEALMQRVGQSHPAVAALRRDRLLRRIIDPNPF